MKNIINVLLKFVFKSDDDLIKELDKEGYSINLLDIGAAGNIEPRWLKIAKYIKYIGIEPDQRSNKSLYNKYKCRSYITIDKILWDEEKDLTFYTTKKPKCSSVLEPNREFLNKFQNANRHEIVRKDLVKSTTISKEFPEKDIDFIKLDTQGAELHILKGGEKKLKNCLGLEIEVQIAELYKKASLFEEIQCYLKLRDFVFIDFVNICRWERSQYNSYGQIAFGDGLWLRTPEYISEHQQEKIYKYISICSLYGRYDLIEKLIEINQIRLESNILNALRRQIKKQKIIRKIHKIFSKIISLISGDYSTIKSHLLY